MSLIAPLSAEDMIVQSMVDASPTKWHIAHTTWFFETLVLSVFLPNYRCYHKDFSYLYNSYYNSLGARMQRPQRGLATRPCLDEVLSYRLYVDKHMEELFDQLRDDAEALARVAPVLTLGVHHEQQHQELLLMDILHLFWHNPLYPSYKPIAPMVMRKAARHDWLDYEGGLVDIGAGEDGFSYDHEMPRHRHFLAPYRLGSRLVTNGEWLEFIEAKGYERDELWLDDGWRWRSDNAITAPLYWRQSGDKGDWQVMTLHGLLPLNEHVPVVHISFYEAYAYCRWRGVRLPTEMEWEHAASHYAMQGNFLSDKQLHPQIAVSAAPSHQFFGDVWEITASAFLPYPGYHRAEGALGEYNGKFMANQVVLRGGSCITPQGHMRSSYRNFFYPSMRWQFGGLRLAADGN